MVRATADIGAAQYAVSIDVSGHHIVADEPKANGGGNTGPAPYDILLASLGACTAITLRMYADRKQWALRTLRVELHYTRIGEEQRITRKLYPEGSLSAEALAHLLEIAERTPVTLTLKQGLTISTELAQVSMAPQPMSDVDKRLDEALEESFPASDSPDVTP